MEIAWALLDRYQQLAGVSERRRVGGIEIVIRREGDPIWGIKVFFIESWRQLILSNRACLWNACAYPRSMNLACDAGEISRGSAISGRLCHSKGSIEISAAELRNLSAEHATKYTFQWRVGSNCHQGWCIFTRRLYRFWLIWKVLEWIISFSKLGK